MRNLEVEIAEEVAKYEHDPLGYVIFAFPWGEGKLAELTGPRKWQREVLADIGKHLQNEETRHQPLQIAVASGHGVGKSALISMLVNWAMSTATDTRVVVTSNTDTQLRSKTSPEIIKWHNLSITKDWFTTTATSLYSNSKEHEKTWKVDLIPWSEHNSEAFAGTHNEGKRILIVFDEASSISDKIWEVISGALTDKNTEIIFIAFGNPTRNTGRFKDCFGRFKHRWLTKQIDSRDVEGVNTTEIAKWEADYGVDSDYFKVRVRGMFPSSSFKQFISTTDVDAAFGKHLREDQYDWAPKIITVDPAWEGDDELVIGMRQGLLFKILSVIPKNDNDVMIANLVARLEDEHKADAVFVDGGYGTGIVSVGRTLNRRWQLVWFAEKALDEGYLNKRAEMWGLTRKWLKEGGAIPKDNDLYADLTGPETVARLDGKIQLESKKDMKARGVKSPNKGDALALSFAYPVQKKSIHAGLKSSHKADYDVFGERD